MDEDIAIQDVWEEMALDEIIMVPCFDCGDEVPVDVSVYSEAILCDMCSLVWMDIVRETAVY